ncbi:ABC transporter type 1, transmembrane domain-containing protein [Jimgerdemannia flammicorona]|uniref:ABC transporter type 1, transmembrane domain-containing protein n=1 Tax=Jimgerdemannia flammicorona TaxID=994334 RepID=A0A433QZ51_9FUNG|nr:ABC transporter type 1, transmembrane domain-containing protein [Jimgerdemannia flammicorona]
MLLILYAVPRLLYTAWSYSSMKDKDKDAPKNWILLLVTFTAAIGETTTSSMNGAIRFLPFTIVGLVLTAGLMHTTFLHNVHRGRSGILSVYWVLVVAFGVVKTRTLTVTYISTLEPTRYAFFIVQFILALALLFLEQVPTRTTNPILTNPEATSSPASILFFHWIQPLITKSYKGQLDFSDLWAVPDFLSLANAHAAFSKHWAVEVKKPKPSLLRAIFKAFGLLYISPILCILIASTLQYLQPSLLNPLLTFINSYAKDSQGAYINTPQPLSVGIVVAVGLFLLSVIASIFSAWFFKLACNFGFVIRAAMIAAIYRKSLRLSPASRQTATVGEITNRMSVDAENFFWSAQSLGLVVTTFYQIALALYFLYGQLSWAIFAGLGVILLTFPLNYWIGSSFNKWMKGKMQNMDRRMRLMNEIIGGIKIVKLYAWEKPFVDKVNEAREDEVKFLKQFGQGIAWITVMFTVAPYLVSIACFGVYAGVLADKEHPLDSVRIFVSLTQNVSSFMQTYVALNRIRDFLLLEEVDDSAVLHLPYDTTLPSIVLNSASVAWAADAKPTLSDVNLSIARGSLTAVIGRVGSGKTSLISAAIGDMYKQGGTIEIRGSVAYVPQQAWIINATLRENIIFGLAWDESRYRRIIEACCLLADIEMLPGGDMTEIGERGINLSGGQKQRVSLARAVYADADVYLLDDPLSAVDAHVDRALFENVIGPEGLLKEKTRVLVTHGIHHLQNVDEIVALERQRVAECGTYAELMALQGETYKLLVEYSSRPKKEEEEGEAELEEKELDGKVLPVEKEVEPTEEKKLNNGVLVEEERREEGQIGWKVYVTYLKACSLRYVVMFMVVMLLSQGVSVGSRYWLQNWSTQLDAASSIGYYLGIYILLVFGYAFFSFMTGWILLAVAGIRASRVLHGQLLERVFRLKMSFFDTTPLGRITNRFSKDLSSIDEKIPLMMQNWVFMLTSTISSIIVIGVTTPIFLAIVPPITYAFYWVQSHYLWMSRDLKRLESASRSPIYQHFSETLGGISTIRAYDQSDRFVLENVKRSDANVGAFYLWVSSNRWLQLRVEFLGAFIVLGSAIFACVSRESLSPGLVGLAVSYAMTVTGDVTWLVRSYCDMETNIVSVERIKEYVELPTEAAEVTDFPLAEDWPARGVIEFRNYSTRYREGLELVLKGISFNVAQGEKVGIVGRTGAGKSSLTLSLFRLIEAAGPSSAGVAVAEESVEEKRSDNATLQSHDTDTGTGGIYIDGVEISRLGLTTLRSRLSIIPQDPVLFIGTIRDNLDPFGENDDKALWDALESAHLKEHVGGLEGGLNAPVSQGGENFSVGQRQLICLARALLRKTRILVLDEATSATDVQTDELIQKTIRKEFKDRTILTIAHRITTILDSDKILVLDAGRVAEYDTPDKLLADRSSKFYALAKQTGQNRSAEDITAE